MKLYKGDIIKFDYPYSESRCEGKVLSDKGSFGHPAQIKITKGWAENTIGNLGCFNYSMFGNDSEHVNNTVKLIRPGWISRNRRPFIKRLKYLFLNRF